MKSKKKFIAIFSLVLVLTLFFPAFLPFTTTAQAAGMKLNTKKKSLSIGQTYQLKVTNTSKKVKWSSSNKSVAKVNAKGVVTAKKAGTAIITAKIGNKKLKCTITVKSGTAGSTEADKVITLVNQYRAANGVSSLKKHTLLTKAAEIRAKELKQLFSHTRPDGTSCFTAVSPDYHYYYLGENIAAGYPDADSVMNGWMNSPGHRANILNKNYTEIGVAVFEYNGYKYWVQIFGSRSY